MLCVVFAAGLFWKVAFAAPTTRTYKTYYKVRSSSLLE